MVVRRSIAAALTAAALVAPLAGCVTSPKQTVLNLDTTDRKWSSRKCIQARKEAAQFNEHTRQRLAVGIGGNLLVPFAGAGAATAWTISQNKARKRLNEKIDAACISPTRPPAKPS